MKAWNDNVWDEFRNSFRQGTANEEEIEMGKNDAAKWTNNMWDGILTVSLTIGEYIGIHKDYAKAAMAIDLLKGRNDIPEPIIEALDDFIENVNSNVIDHCDDALEEIFDED